MNGLAKANILRNFNVLDHNVDILKRNWQSLKEFYENSHNESLPVDIGFIMEKTLDKLNEAVVIIKELTDRDKTVNSLMELSNDCSKLVDAFIKIISMEIFDDFQWEDFEEPETL